MDLQRFQAERGLTLKALAALLGRPVSTVHGWLNGTRRPDWASIEDITRATGGVVTANDFHLPVQRRGLAETQAAFVIEAQTLGLDPAVIAAKAVREAVGWEKARRWAEENREAIAAWNRWVEENGLPLEEYRMF